MKRNSQSKSHHNRPAKKEYQSQEKRQEIKTRRKRKKQKQKEKKKKERIQLKGFKEKAEEKKKELRKLHEKELVEKASALKKFARQFTVGRELGFDPKSFFNVAKQNLLQILREIRQQKVKLILKCLMKKIDLKTGEETKVEAAFHSETEINLSGTNEKKLLNVIIEEALKNMAQFQRRGSNWRYADVFKLEIHLVDFFSIEGKFLDSSSRSNFQKEGIYQHEK